MSGLSTKDDEGNFEKLQLVYDQLCEAYVIAHQRDVGVAARPIVDEHLRRGSKALRYALIQARETRFRAPEYRGWLDAEIDALTDLEATFDRRSGAGNWLTSFTTIFGLPGLTSALAATGVTTGVLAILRACLCHLTFLVPLFISIAVFVTFNLGFLRKRQLFLTIPADVDGGVYHLEDEIFAVIGETKARERPLDVLGFLLMTIAFLAASVVGRYAIKHGLFVNKNFFLTYIYAGGLALVTALSYLNARQRTPS
jgi:hypothetical protein